MIMERNKNEGNRKWKGYTEKVKEEKYPKEIPII